MAETTYILIDDFEKRVLTGHNQDLDGIMAALSKNPTCIVEFDQYHQDVTGNRLYDHGNRPKVPEEISLDTIRTTLGMADRSEEDVLRYWKESNLYEGPNYEKFAPDKRTDYDIPELTPEIIDEWKQEDPDAEEFHTANDYRRFLCNDGIVVADLRTKEVRYISPDVFDIPRARPTKHDLRFNLCRVSYTLPKEWKIVRE